MPKKQFIKSERGVKKVVVSEQCYWGMMNVYMMSDVKKAHRGIPAVNQGSLVRDEC